MHKFHYIIAPTIYLAICTSCEKQKLLHDCLFENRIPVSIDWSNADLDPNNDPEENLYSSSLWLYPKNGLPPIEYKFTDPRGESISVPEGHYSVILFNNATIDYSNMIFLNPESYSLFHVVAVPEKTNSKMSNNISLIKEPEILAVWSLDDFIVTKDMFTQNSCDSIQNSLLNQLKNIQPRRLTLTIDILFHVKNINSASAASGILNNMATKGNLSTNISAKEYDNSLFLVVNNRKYYDGSVSNGTVQTSIRTFGKAIESKANNKYTIEVKFKRRDNLEIETFVIDISEQISSLIPSEKSHKINIVLGSKENPIIELKKLEPGIDVGLGEWEDEDVNVGL